MKAEDYAALKELLIKITELKNFEYNNAHILTEKFLTLGKESDNPYATEDYDTIKEYLESSQRSKSDQGKAQDWETACDMLYDNIEVIIQTNSAD